MYKMDIMPPLVVFVVSFPEAILISLFGMQMVGIRPKIPYLILAALLQALSSYFIRALPIDFGYHIPIHLFVYAIILWLVLKISYIATQIAILIGFTCYLALESSIVPLIIETMGEPIEAILSQPSLRLTAFLPQALVFTIILIVTRKLNLSLFKAETYAHSKVDNDEHK